MKGAAVSEVVFRRDVPPAGVYGCVATHGFLPWLVRRVTNSWANHVVISIGDGQIVEAEPGGVRIRDIAEYVGCRIEYNDAEPMTMQQRAAVAEYAESKRGEPYCWTADAVDGLAALGIRWRILGRFEQVRRSVMCSELAAQAGRYAGLDWSCGQANDAAVTPALLAARIDDTSWA